MSLGTIAARQRADRIIREKPALTKLFEVLGPRYQDRDGGYTRVLQLAKKRKGDNAPMAIIEYVDRPGEIRAARPPQQRRSPEKLSEVLADMGIPPLTPEQMASLQNQYEQK
jgi:large subunit ribosomal protein L17